MNYTVLINLCTIIIFFIVINNVLCIDCIDISFLEMFYCIDGNIKNCCISDIY